MEVEEVGEGSGSAASLPTGSDPVRPIPAPAKRSQIVVPGKELVTSPMPGTVISVRVRDGDRVRAGDILIVLESMKIQTDITAPTDGTVEKIYVEENQYVRAKEHLVSISIG